MRHTRAVSRAVAAAVIALSLGCGGGSAPTQSNNNNPPPPPPGTPKSIVVTNNTFSPANLTVASGSSVTWTWNTCTGGDPYGDGQTCVDHNVVFDDGSVTSGVQSKGSFVHQFPTAGTYAYHCAIHGAAMSGKVIVQ